MNDRKKARRLRAFSGRSVRAATFALLLLAGSVLCGSASAQEEHAHVHQHPAVTEQTQSQVGLEERLGVSIPLDATFYDETGRRVTLRELVTVPTVIAPVYYSCPNVCSFLQGGLARALTEVKLDPGTDFRVLSVSFDETDTPEIARRSQAIYMDAMGQRFPEKEWHFLTGDRENIRQLLDAAGYRFKRQGNDFLHPVAMFVVAADGKIVRYLHGTSVLPMDLTLALVEASEGRIGPTIRRVAQFCFSYDPESRRYVFNLFRVSAVVILLTAGAFMAFLILRGRKNPDRPR